MNNFQGNTITISENLINNTLKDKVLSSSAGDYLKDYKVSFSQGYVFLDLKLSIKTLGPLAAKYRIEVVDLIFRQGNHILIADYIEDIQSQGGIAQAMMLKAAGLKGGTYLQTALSMAKVEGIKADEKSCSLDLEQLLDLNNRLGSMLVLKYLDSRNGEMKLAYDIAM
jgi:hypothetical protein